MSPAITILAPTAKIVLGVVILASPPMRNALVGLDPGMPALLLLVAAAWAVVARLRPKATRSSELHLLRLLRRWGWLFAILLFVSPLLAHWSQQPTSRVAAFSAQLGHIPWFDARDHYEGALRVVTTGEFGAFSERRPANACWLAVLLAVAGWKLQMALLLQAALVGVLVWLACRAIAVRFGLAPSVAFFAVVLGLGRDYLPTPNTETLGIALSSLSSHPGRLTRAQGSENLCARPRRIIHGTRGPPWSAVLDSGPHRPRTVHVPGATDPDGDPARSGGCSGKRPRGRLERPLRLGRGLHDGLPGLHALRLDARVELPRRAERARIRGAGRGIGGGDSARPVPPGVRQHQERSRQLGPGALAEPEEGNRQGAAQCRPRCEPPVAPGAGGGARGPRALGDGGRQASHVPRPCPGVAGARIAARLADRKA